MRSAQPLINEKMTSPFKLALLIVVLAASMVTTLYRVHRAAQFAAKDPGSELEHIPEEMGGPMNILLFYADDWRHDTLGAAGNPVVKTPALDSLAADGVRFSENCVTTSICWISRELPPMAHA